MDPSQPSRAPPPPDEPTPPRETSNGGLGGDGSPGQRKPFLLRLPPKLMEELRIWANQEVRSLNGHIEYLLRDAVKRRQGESGRPPS